MKGILKRSGWNLDIIIHNMIKEKNYIKRGPKEIMVIGLDFIF